MTTASDIQNMSDVEIKALNKTLTRKLATRIALQIGVTVAVSAAISYAGRRLDAKNVLTAVTD